jgi:hypothetical protein
MISTVFRRILRLLEGIRLIRRVHTVTHTGDIMSTNDIYQSRHWGVRNTAEKKFTKIFRKLFSEDTPPKVTEFGLVMFYNNTMDVCNLTFMEKVFVDSFRREIEVTKLKDPTTKRVIKEFREIVYEGFVANDDQRYFKFLVICPDKNLPKSTVEFNICVL